MDDDEKNMEIRTDLMLGRCVAPITNEGEKVDSHKLFELIKGDRNVNTISPDELRETHEEQSSSLRETYEEQPSSSKDAPKIASKPSKEASKEIPKRTSKTSKESVKETPKRSSKTCKGSSKETPKRSSKIKK